MAKRFRSFLSSAGRNWAGPTRHVVRGPTTAPTWKRQGNDKAATKTDNRRTPCQRSFRLEPLPLACVGLRRSGRLSAVCGAGFQVAYGKGFPYATRLRDSQRNIHSGNHDCAGMHAHCAETSRWALPCFFHMFRHLRHHKATGNKQRVSRTFTIMVSERGLREYRELNKYNIGLATGKCGLVIKRSRSKHDPSI